MADEKEREPSIGLEAFVRAFPERVLALLPSALLMLDC